MIPGADIVQVAPVGRVAQSASNEAADDARQQAFQRALAGQVGRQVHAHVLSRLTDGSFLVQVAGATARMLLPSNPAPGTALPMTLLSVEPRPTFSLGAEAPSAPIAAVVQSRPGLATTALYAPASAAMAGAAMTASVAPADAGPASSEATLSETARVISSVLAAASQAAHPQTAIVAALPLLTAPPANPAALAVALKDAIDASGLFYESHVAEWSAGMRPRAALEREPQMQRAQPGFAGAGGAAAPPGDTAATQAATPAAMPGALSAAADPATAQFINLQLTSQEQGRVAWQGQLWPGQDLAWQISRDAPERDTANDDGTEPKPEPAWRSALRLRFPLLGEIGATVVLSGEQVHITLQAGTEEIGALLRARAGTLRSALATAGSPLTQLSVGAVGAPGHD
ncbi:MAG: flagellar hook-length control protein FliK [Massilia sp.]|nr:flagellar hook-length control protein FliK [Massilia sp.]